MAARLPLAVIFGALLAVTAGAGLLIVHVLDGVDAWDTEVVVELADGRTPTMDTWTERGTWLAETVPVLVITAITMIVAWRATRHWVLPLFVLCAVGGEKLVYLIATFIVLRDRPPVPTLGGTEATHSYPSGHVGSAMAMYGAIAVVVGVLTGRRALRTALLLVAVALAAIVAYCRMYRGFHYPTDCIAGVVVGAVTVGGSWWVLLRPGAGFDRPRTQTPARR